MAIRSDEARDDIAARSFWVTGQMVFFHMRVFNPIAKRYVHMETSKAYQLNEKEKKKNYNERILEVEHGSFMPICISAYGGIEKEGSKFYNRLAELLVKKKNQQLSVMTSWIRRKLIFHLINSICMCIRGSRRVFQTNLVGSVQLVDPVIAEASSRI